MSDKSLVGICDGEFAKEPTTMGLKDKYCPLIKKGIDSYCPHLDLENYLAIEKDVLFMYRCNYEKNC